jgi:serine/threonine protein kinase
MKIFRKVPAAAREMEFRSIPSHPNILPILDFGEYKNDYVLIMPRADKSLDRYIETQRRSFLLENAIPILLDIAEALASLHGNVVHQMRGSIGFLNAHANTP